MRMPVITIGIERLMKLLGEDLDISELSEYLFTLKSETENIDEEQGKIEIEINSDRPDLLISEGIARAIKGLLGKEVGLPKLNTSKTNYTLEIKNVPSRPYIAMGIIYNYELTEEVLEELIQFQEKLHSTIGRNRKKIAIGIHDLDKIRTRNFEYKEIDIRKEEMLPLHQDKRMKVIEVIEQLEQGREYGEISIRDSYYHPAIYADGEIISLPPVINSDITRLEPGTKNLLIDVTGTDLYTVNKTLDIILSILSEREKNTIGTIACHDINGETILETPRLERGEILIKTEYINKMLGFTLTTKQIIDLLLRMRWEAEPVNNNEIFAIYPEYRIDILHPIDVVEDIAVSWGYDKIPIQKPTRMLVAEPNKIESFQRLLARIVSGLGFIETKTFTMIPNRIARLLIEEKEEIIAISNPISQEMSVIRPNIISSIILTLKENMKGFLPLKIFEIGETASITKTGRITVRRKIGLGYMDDEVSFEDIHAPIHALIEALGLVPSTKKKDYPGLIKGRSASIFANNRLVGFLGEVHPSILVENKIKYPIAVAELDIEELFNLWVLSK